MHGSTGHASRDRPLRPLVARPAVHYSCVVLKKLLRLTAFSLIALVILWLMRERFLPVPRRAIAPTTDLPVPPSVAETPDDLTEVKGIGPVYAGRLTEAGIATLRSLSETDAERVAAATGVTAQAAEDWIAQAATKL